MSQSAPALGSRENWYAGGGYDGGQSDADAPADHHDEYHGVSKLKYVAGSYLRTAGDATILCYWCFHDEERPAELSDPEHYVEPSTVEQEDGTTRERYADHRRHRHCTECGAIAWGGVLQDRPTDVFLALVQDIVEFAGIADRPTEEIVADARGRKARGISDTANMEHVLADIEHPEQR